MHPDIRQLEIFIALEKHRSFTGAAHEVLITQSAVSRSIKNLEEQMGCSLIERQGKTCKLTPHGEVFLYHARKVMHELENCSAKLRVLNKVGYSSIRLSASASICQYIIPQVLQKFQQLYPQCEVSITPCDSAQSIDLIALGHVDLAIGLHKNEYCVSHKCKHLVSDKLCFITDRKHPWATSPPRSLEDFKGAKYISYGNHTVTSEIVRTYFDSLNIPQTGLLCLANMESIKEMTMLGMGVGIVADWLISEEVAKKTIIKYELDDPPTRKWVSYANCNKKFSSIEKDFVQLVKIEMQKAVSA